MPKLRMNMVVRLLLLELESMVLGKGVRWLGKIRKEAANNIRGFGKLCSETGGGEGSLPGWSIPILRDTHWRDQLTSMGRYILFYI